MMVETKGGRRVRHRFFIRLFTTSLINISIIVVGLFWFLQFSFMDTVQAEIRTRDQEVLRQIQKRIDENLVAMRRTALSISLDSVFSPFDLPDDPLRAIEAIQALRGYSFISTDLSLVGIAYESSDFALTDKGSVGKWTFDLYDIPPFGELMNSESLSRGFISTESTLVFLFPYPMQAPMAPRGVIFCLIRKEPFAAGLLESVSGHERYLSISNTVNGEVLLTNGPTNSAGMNFTEYFSETTGYLYRIATPDSYFESILASLRLKTAIVLALLLVLGVLLNLGIARYNALPLRRLLGKLAHNYDDEAFESVESILEERKAADARAKRDIFLLELTQGVFVDLPEVRARAEAAGLDFSGSSIAFLAVHAGSMNFDALRSPSDMIQIGENRFYRQRLLFGENEVWAVNGSDSGIMEKTLVEFRTTAYADEPAATIGIGSVSGNPRNAAQSFLEALSAVNYRVVRGSGGIIRFDSLPKADAVDWPALDERLAGLRTALQQFDYDAAGAAVSAVIDQCAGLSLSSARHILWRLLQSFDDQDLIKNGVPVRQLATIGNVEELFAFIRAQTGGALSRLSGAMGGIDNDLVTDIKTYTEIHFDDRLLSLDSLADSLGYSVGYLCKVFKQNTGMTVANYIQEMRLHEACRLLRSSDLPVKDIVQKVGYMDHASFSRSFKIHTGFSPQEYRLHR